MMYPNLKAEMVRAGYSNKDLADVLGIHICGISMIFSGTRNLSVSRAVKIRDALFPGMRLDYLFDNEPDVPTNAEDKTKNG